MVAMKYRDQLERIKKLVEKTSIANKENNKRFHESIKFIFKTALNADDEANLTAMGKPIIEFNINNAPVSRLCGEFSKQEPSITVMAEEGAQIDPQVIQVVEGHIRHILFDAKKHNTQYSIYKDQLAGGFTTAKVWTEYANDMSFDQVIRFGRVYEPTLCGFDPNAREIDKRDAEFCFELFPMPKEKFKAEYPDVDIENMQYLQNTEEFNWAYSTNQDEIIILCDFYQKKRKRKKIVKLANNKVMTVDEYAEFVQDWMDKGITEQPPAIVGNPRWTVTEIICRYRLIGTEVIDYIETDYKYLPLVFFDGDSVILKEGESGAFSQFTKPYPYHAKGIQRLVNFSGQVIANDFENMVMHKFKVAKESIPQEEQYQEAYKNVQLASTLVYNAFMDGDPDKPVPAPVEIARVGLPSEVLNTFNGAMQMMQNILGSYDAALGINDNQLSGTAIVEAATQSNAAAMPYVVAHMQSLNHVANIFLDLIPKYYVTPRTIPVVGRDGIRTYQKINQPGGVSFNYDENALSVKVEAGPNFAIQKSRALMQISTLMQSSELFAQFMNEVGLDFILDNMEFKGSDLLAERARQWMQQLQQRQQQAAQQPNPMVLQEQNEQKRLQQKDTELQLDSQIKSQQLMIEKMKADNERLDVMVKSGESRDKLMIAIAKAHAEEERARADLHLNAKDMAHNHAMDIHDRLTEKKEEKKNEV